MNGVVVAQAPIRPGCDDSIATLNGPESERCKHIALHAPVGVNHPELLMPKSRLEGWEAVRSIAEASLFHSFRSDERIAPFRKQPLIQVNERTCVNEPVRRAASSSDLARCLAGDHELSLGLQQNLCSKPATFPIECLLNPFDVALQRKGELEVLDLQRNELECLKTPASWLQIDEIHQRQVVAVALIAANSLIVVQKITAAVEDKAIAVDFNWPRMMRRMPMNDRDASLVD